MTTWISDNDGNRASVERWGSEAAALASLATLTRCSCCSDCSDCSRCRDCSHCARCSGCSLCSGCSGCSDCSEIDGPHIVGPRRTDGNYFVLVRKAAGPMIHAGCRKFTLPEARAHWARTRGGTQLGYETTAILDYLESRIPFLPERKS